MKTPRDHLLVSCAFIGCLATACGGLANDGSAGAAKTSGSTLSAAYAVASDASGQKLVATGTDIWASNDGGLTWSNRTASGPAHDHAWTSVASDASETKLVAVVNGDIHLDTEADPVQREGDIWASNDSGTTWTDQTPSGPAHRHAWFSVASSLDGTKLVALAASQGVLGPGAICTSNDSGVTWTNQILGNAAMEQRRWVSAASDATGTMLVAAADSGGIWTSSNEGVTWTDRTNSGAVASPILDLGVVGWSSVASDSTGHRLVAVADTGDIYGSSDAGVTWTDETPSGPASDQLWSSVASDMTGMHLIAVDALVTGNDGDIWISNDGGGSWTDQTTEHPTLSRDWGAVASNSSGSHFVAVGSDGVWVD